MNAGYGSAVPAPPSRALKVRTRRSRKRCWKVNGTRRGSFSLPARKRRAPRCVSGGAARLPAQRDQAAQRGHLGSAGGLGVIFSRHTSPTTIEVVPKPARKSRLARIAAGDPVTYPEAAAGLLCREAGPSNSRVGSRVSWRRESRRGRGDRRAPIPCEPPAARGCWCRAGC